MKESSLDLPAWTVLSQAEHFPDSAESNSAMSWKTRLVKETAQIYKICSFFVVFIFDYLNIS